MPQKKKTRAGAAPALTFNHAMVYVKDLPAALHFYSGLLGFPVIETYPGAYARLRSPRGQSSIALHVAEPGHEPTRSGGIRLYFEIKELDKFCKRLEAAGAKLSQQPKVMPWGWKHAYLDDPDGNEVSLYWAGAKRMRKTAMPGAKRALV